MLGADESAEFLYNVRNSTAREYPFTHFMPTAVFSEKTLSGIRENWPSDSAFQGIASLSRVTKGAYAERQVLDFSSLMNSTVLSEAQLRFWKIFFNWLCSDYVIKELASWLAPYVYRARRFSGPVKLKSEAILVSDRNNYAIGPHTDAANRVFTLLIYLPDGVEAESAGTTIYKPKDDKFNPGISSRHYDSKDFERCYTSRFLPNTGLGFVVSEHSFHGVEPVSIAEARRKSLMYFLKLDSNGAQHVDN